MSWPLEARPWLLPWFPRRARAPLNASASPCPIREAQAITGVAVLFAASFNMVNACSLVYDRNVNTVSLGFDNPANGATPVVPGSNQIASNTQCTLKAANTTVVIGTNSVVLTLDLSFNSVYFGAKNVYLLGAEPGVNSGWMVVGSWTVTGGSPTADSVMPSSGSGTTPTFTFVVSDSAVQTNITAIDMLFTAGSPTNIVNACDLVYNRTAQTIGLFTDDVSTLNVKGIGSSRHTSKQPVRGGLHGHDHFGKSSVSFSINLVFSRRLQRQQGNLCRRSSRTPVPSWVSRGVWTVSQTGYDEAMSVWEDRKDALC